MEKSLKKTLPVARRRDGERAASLSSCLGGADELDQVAERIQGAAELAWGGEDRAAVDLHIRVGVEIRERRDQDVAAKRLEGRGARGMRRLLPEILDRGAAAGAAEGS